MTSIKKRFAIGFIGLIAASFLFVGTASAGPRGKNTETTTYTSVVKGKHGKRLLRTVTVTKIIRKGRVVRTTRNVSYKPVRKMRRHRWHRPHRHAYTTPVVFKPARKTVQKRKPVVHRTVVVKDTTPKRGKKGRNRR